LLRSRQLAGVSDIWVQGGSVTTEKPSNWMQGISVTIHFKPVIVSGREDLSIPGYLRANGDIVTNDITITVSSSGEEIYFLHNLGNPGWKDGSYNINSSTPSEIWIEGKTVSPTQPSGW